MLWMFCLNENYNFQVSKQDFLCYNVPSLLKGIYAYGNLILTINGFLLYTY
jgi:hypothetical protein